MWKKYKSKILWTFLGIFLVGQLFRPAQNSSGDDAAHIRTVLPISTNEEAVLKKQCYDCHSNRTEYPWYAHVQPVAGWIAHHVEEGKDELNFSVFSTYRLRRQYHKLEEVVEQIEQQEMPLNSYTWLHGNLSDGEKQTLLHWAKSSMDSLRARYPIDSLVKKK